MDIEFNEFIKKKTLKIYNDKKNNIYTMYVHVTFQ